MNSEPKKETEVSYYSQTYADTCGKMIEKILTEFEYKTLSKYFQVKSLSHYDEERFRNFFKQVIDYFQSALKVFP